MTYKQDIESDARTFPIQSDGLVRGKGHTTVTAIPWWLAEIAYEHYKERWGGGQTLEGLAKRGGFGRDELVKLIRQER